MSHVIISCPPDKLASSITFYAALGLSLKEEKNEDVTRLDAVGYENSTDPSENFELILVKSPSFQLPSNAENESGGMVDQLVFYSHDVSSVCETLESLGTCTFILTPQDLGARNIVALVTSPNNVRCMIVQLQSERFYVSDHQPGEYRLTDPNANNWVVRLGYVQLLVEYPEESAIFLSELFEEWSIQDREDVTATKFVFIGSAPRDANVTFCLKYAAHRVSSNGGRQDDNSSAKHDDQLMPGTIIGIGVKSANMPAVDQRIAASRHSNLAQILHLGRPLSLREAPSSRPSFPFLSVALPEGKTYELCEDGKHQHHDVKLQVCVLPFSL
jgi:hypothetical protein